ncbi:MAG: nucleotidyltransferase domain-containing protein [Chloroflexi bacterium]|nr:nucleotidyltransferase domain-containing protein [Chloroflexota bacterium]
MNHLNPLTEQLQPVTSALQEALGDDLVALVLFGSRARGDARPDSDWDLLLIAEGLPERPFARHLALKRYCRHYGGGYCSLNQNTYGI